MTYLELRAEMLRQGIYQECLGRKINRSLQYVNRRFNRHADWKQGDMYAILSVLRIPLDQIYKYFPPDGIAS